jgi:Zn-dependent protease with chaperone function
MDFFGRQAQAKKATTRLVVLFVLAVLAIALAIYLVASLVFVYADGGERAGWYHPELLWPVLLGVLAFVGIASAGKVAMLRSGGGGAVARMLGGRVVPPGSSDPDERKLLNVVEEVAIASGVPVPPVYVLDEEDGINAIAAGYRPQDAVVAVTRGTLQQLPRDELQGVVAHEFSHVLNGDMRLNIRLLGLLFGITCIATAGEVVLRSTGRRGGSRKGGGQIALLGLGLLVIGWVGTFFASLIRAAVSRQREFLADAAAVQFTRNPQGLGNALKRIGGFPVHGRLVSAHAKETSHMFFASALSGFGGLFATHPPLEQRIKAIDASFDAARAREVAAAGAAAGSGVPALGFAAGPAAAGARKGGASVRIGAAEVVQQVGQPTSVHLDLAMEWLKSLPLALAVALRDPFSARAVVLALLLDRDATRRQLQLDALEERTDAATFHEVVTLAGAVAAIDPAERLGALDLALPALREMSPGQFDRFERDVKLLVEADAELSLFEFALQKIVLRRLAANFRRAAPPRPRHHKVDPILDQALVLLSALSELSADDEAGRERAFRAGTAVLAPPASFSRTLARRPPAECTLLRLDQALDAVALAVPAVEKQVLQACAAVVTCDGRVRVAEAELLRAIADTLDCPLPPLVERAA